MSNENFSQEEVSIDKEQLESINEEGLAREIIQDNDFERSSRELEQEGVLPAQVTRVMELYHSKLENAEFLTGQDWEMVTMMELYSPELVKHCIETYLLVRSKIEKIYIGGETVADVIEKERVPLDKFYRACLFHDIGKLHIPVSILDNTFTKDEWIDHIYNEVNNNPDEKTCERLGLLVGEDMNNVDIAEILEEKDLCYRSVLPINTVLTEEQIESLEGRGISADLTFKEVCNSHEISSQEILEGEGLHTEALIAGQHHNYQHKPYIFPVSSKTVGVGADLSDLLHLADVEQALESGRSYKSSFTRLDVLDLLIKNIEKESIDKGMTALWVRSEIPDIVVDGGNQRDVSILSGIKLFIAQNMLTEEEKIPS